MQFMRYDSGIGYTIYTYICVCIHAFLTLNVIISIHMVILLLQIAERKKQASSVDSDSIPELEGDSISYDGSEKSLPSNSNPRKGFSSSGGVVENRNDGTVLSNHVHSREKEALDEGKKKNDKFSPSEMASSRRYFDEQFKNKWYEGKKTVSPNTVTKDLANGIETYSRNFENLERESESSSEVAYETDNVASEDEKPPPLAGTNVMNIILVSAECAPWSKTGNITLFLYSMEDFLDE